MVQRQFHTASFQVYPNPSDSPTVELPLDAIGSKLEIITLNGRMVYAGTVFSRTLHLPALESGIYLASLTDPMTGARQHSRIVRM